MLLFTPGPTPVPEAVRKAMASQTLHHRTPEFEAIFAQARAHLFELIPMKEVVMLASTGTGAMESAVTNLCHTKLLSINAGKFGERFAKIALAHGLQSEELRYAWDTPCVIDDVLDALEKDSSIDTIAIQVSESAGGLRHPAEDMAKAVKQVRPDIMIIADGITAVGVEPIDVSSIDALIAGSQKAMMLPPGLAVVGLSDVAIEKMGEGRGFYFNLATEMKKQQANTTAWTAATTLVAGINALFELINENGGLISLYLETAVRARATREALLHLGLNLYPAKPAPSMSTVIDDDANAIRALLKEEYGVNVAGGQDHLKGKIFRINQMGLIPEYEMSWVVNAVELALHKLGRRAYNGEATKMFNEVYFGL